MPVLQNARRVIAMIFSMMALMVAPQAGLSPEILRRLADLETALGSAIRGKPEVVRLSVVCLLARGHLLDLLYAHAPQDLYLQVADLLVDQHPGQLEGIGLVYQLQQLFAHALLGRVGNFLFHGRTHLGAKFRHAAFGQAKSTHERFVKCGQALFLDELDGQLKHRILACYRSGGVKPAGA